MKSDNDDDLQTKWLERLIACQNYIVRTTVDEVKARKNRDAFLKGSDFSDALSQFILERFPNLDEKHRNSLKTVIGELQKSQELPENSEPSI